MRVRLPDWVADARRWSNEERAINRYDTLRRARLPLAMYTMELEWRVHPVEGALWPLANKKVALVLLLALAANALVIAPVIRAFGSGFFSPSTYPVLCMLCILAAYCRFAMTSSILEAAWWFFLPQLMGIFLEISFSPGVNQYWVLVPVAASVVAICYLADQASTHYVRWITAN